MTIALYLFVISFGWFKIDTMDSFNECEKARHELVYAHPQITEGLCVEIKKDNDNG